MKYGNTMYHYNGVAYASKLESLYAQSLDLRMRAGEVSRWERQVRFKLTAHGVEICSYSVDFAVYYPDGRVEFVDTKGFQTPQFRLKWKLFVAQMRREMPKAALVLQYRGGRREVWKNGVREADGGTGAAAGGRVRPRPARARPRAKGVQDSGS